MPDNSEREDGSPHETDRRTFRGEDARQGFIVLRTPARRAIFVAGLVGLAVLGILLTIGS